MTSDVLSPNQSFYGVSDPGGKSVTSKRQMKTESYPGFRFFFFHVFHLIPDKEFVFMLLWMTGTSLFPLLSLQFLCHVLCLEEISSQDVVSCGEGCLSWWSVCHCNTQCHSRHECLVSDLEGKNQHEKQCMRQEKSVHDKDKQEENVNERRVFFFRSKAVHETDFPDSIHILSPFSLCR